MIGRIIGGNFNIMVGIWGSWYMLEIKVGDILFIEDFLKGIENVECFFVYFVVCGVFEWVSVIILGKYELFDNKGIGRIFLDVLIEVLVDKNVFIFYGFDSCYMYLMFVILLGVWGIIDFDNYIFKLEDCWVKVK